MIILGGGLAGLTAAISSGAKVYESNSRPGGISRSETVDGFTFDYGIHILQTENLIVHQLLDQAGVCMETNQRNAHIYSHGCHTAYPFQVNTAGLPLGTRFNCVWNFLRRPRAGRCENYEQWMLQNLGTGFSNTFLIPYSEKFWTIHPREMTFEWTGGRVPQPNFRQVLYGALVNRQTDFGTNAIFQYPEGAGGYGTIPEALARQVKELYLDHRAIRIDVAGHRIQFNNEIETAYDYLISTIPLPELVKLIPEAPEPVRRAAGKLRCNSIYVVNLGIDRPDIATKNWVHYPEKEISFFRISYPFTFTRNVVPAGMSSVTAEVAYADWSPLDKDTIVDRVIEDLVRVGAIAADDRIVLKTTMDIKYGYVLYDHERASALGTIHDWLCGMDIYSTGRYGSWEYMWSHDAMMAGKQTAEQVMKLAKSAKQSADV